MNLTLPPPEDVASDEWKEFEAMIGLKKLNKFLSALALIGVAAILVFFFDLSDTRVDWA